MRRFVWPCLFILSLAVLAGGCGHADQPKGISIKEDTRLQRVGEGKTGQGQNRTALPPQ
jgi:hypothetical protein